MINKIDSIDIIHRDNNNITNIKCYGWEIDSYCFKTFDESGRVITVHPISWNSISVNYEQ